MSKSYLPDRPSLEYLKKLAKERLAQMRRAHPAAKLAEAQLQIANEHGFTSWRSMKEEVDRRRAGSITAFFAACATGEVEAARQMLDRDSSLARERERGDNATPLHIAAANKHLEVVRLLLDAGADPNDRGDMHDGGVIGWAIAENNGAVIELLLERGARHHIFSAIALGDPDLVERVVEDDPLCLDARRSRFENEQTPVHAAFAAPDGLGGAPRYDVLEKLIELGADIEATDNKGRTPLAVALLSGDQEAARILRAAGAAEPPSPVHAGSGRNGLSGLASSVSKLVPSINVPDIAAALDWYVSIGFTEVDRHADGATVNFGMVSLGEAYLAFGMGSGPRNVSLWFYTDRVQALYEVLKARQLRHGDAPFQEDLYEPFYGGRQFSIRDPNGCDLIFHDPA